MKFHASGFPAAHPSEQSPSVPIRAFSDVFLAGGAGECRKLTITMVEASAPSTTRICQRQWQCTVRGGAASLRSRRS